MLIVLLLSQIVQSFASSDLCNLPCSKQGLSSDICKPDCEPRTGNCCWKDGVVQVDLRNCGIEELSANSFSKDSILFNQTAIIQRVCLDHNDFSIHNVSGDAFRGLTDLQVISLPARFGYCPGGKDFWTTSKPSESMLLCEGQKRPCNTSGEVCPEKSHCVDDGPGLMRCECDKGYFGYKCLKSGRFPYATFYGSLGAATFVLSAVLWFVGRRKIGLHNKQS